ncbi:MAG: right-handed parallel beta-helix repeat-containing protein, partial [Armatimonadota bacterium]
SKGTYNENLDLKGKTLTLQSTSPTSLATAQATIVQGSLTKPVVLAYKVSGGAVSGLTLKGGLLGVDCNNSSLAVRNCVITANARSGVYAHNGGSTGTVANNQISGNKWGVYCDSTASPTVSGNTIELNASEGVYSSSSARPTITGNLIRNNSDSGIDCGMATVTGNTIMGNTGSYGGGIDCSSNPTITNNLIVGNQATSYGGGILCNDNATLLNNTICGNSARSEHGGNVWLMSASPVISNCIIAFATSGGGIGGSSLTTCHPNISYCDVYGNTDGDYFRITANLPGNIAKDPLFVTRGGAGTYRLKSVGGHYNGSGWVADSVTSPCVDKGDPKSVYTKEPSPNGHRINMGYDGNTTTASKSP